MSSPSPDTGSAGAVPLGARLAHRLARYVATAPTRFSPPTPLVSFTFDDAPDCACSRGAAMLTEAGARGTFYVAGAQIGTRAPHWRLANEAALAALHEAGHEIGCHTHAHPFLPGLSARAVADEVLANRARLRAFLPDFEPESFAYPYGFASPAAKRALRGRFRSSRGIRPGLNHGRGDRHLLRANPLIEGALDPAAIARLMDEALARNGWLIFYGHDVRPDPSPFGCAPGLLAGALRAAQARRIPCVTVAEGLARALAGPARAGEEAPAAALSVPS